MKATVPSQAAQAWSGEIRVASGLSPLGGTLDVPPRARGLVLFAHGSGSRRHSPRNRHVAQALQHAGLATLLFDLLTPAEEAADALTGHLRFDIELLAARLRAATKWCRQDARTLVLRVGYFGSSTGAAAALVAAAEEPEAIAAIVSRGGRPDLARAALELVRAPTLLIVGGDDTAMIPLHALALEKLPGVKRMEIVPGATHLFEEPGTLDLVARLAVAWFGQYLPGEAGAP